MADILDSMTTLISSNWNSANTNGVTPVIGNVFDYKRVDLSKSPQNRGDYILVYATNYLQRPSGINKLSKNTNDLIAVDIRSAVKRSHAEKLKTEVLRILDANFKDPFSGHYELETTDIKDLSDKTTLIWRYVLSVDVLSLNVAR